MKSTRSTGGVSRRRCRPNLYQHRRREKRGGSVGSIATNGSTATDGFNAIHGFNATDGSTDIITPSNGGLFICDWRNHHNYRYGAIGGAGVA